MIEQSGEKLKSLRRKGLSDKDNNLLESNLMESYPFLGEDVWLVTKSGTISHGVVSIGFTRGGENLSYKILLDNGKTYNNRTNKIPRALFFTEDEALENARIRKYFKRHTKEFIARYKEDVAFRRIFNIPRTWVKLYEKTNR